MTLSTGVALSQSDNPSVACREAVEAAIADAGGTVRVVLCLPSAGYTPDEIEAAVHALRAHVDEAVQIAGSCVGGFTYQDTVVDGFLAGQKGVLAIAFGGADHALVYVPDVRADGARAGATAAAELERKLGGELPSACLMFVPGFAEDNGVSSNAFVGAFTEALPNVSVTGGGANCGMTQDGQMVAGHTFVDGRTSTDSALVLAFGKSVPAATGFANAMQEDKKLGRAGGVAGPLFTTVGGAPAAQAYRAAFEGNERDLIEKNPMIGGMELGVTLATHDPATGTFWPATAAAFLPDDSVITFPATLEDGEELFVARVHPDHVLGAVETTGQRLRDHAGGEDVGLVLAHSCTMRNFHLKERAGMEEELLGKQIPGSKIVKILAIGEVASTPTDRPMHRFTSYAFSAIGWGR